MEKYKDLVADLQPYKQYLPVLQEFFTTDIEQMKIRDELIKLLSCETDEQVAQNIIYTRDTMCRGGYTWQFNKDALKQFFDMAIANAQKQQKWTKKQWIAIAIEMTRMMERQYAQIQQTRANVARAIEIAGYAAERGADKARPTATDTKTRLHDFGDATRKLGQKTDEITTADIQKLQTILNGKRRNDYTD
ncbi:MAG: hypothetical protein NC311_00175 [Muribaculaceae bacterium]|nr:hypothetical protein [Muribaculaceae bacterium]